MNTSRLFLWIVILVVSVDATYAEQVYLEIDTAPAYFKDYVNNLGENTLNTSFSKAHDNLIETGVRWNMYKNRLPMNLDLSHDNDPIDTGFLAGNKEIPLHYDSSYKAFRTSFIYSCINATIFKLKGHTHLSADGLISGTSDLKSVVNKLRKDKTFARKLILYQRGVSAACHFSKNMAFYISDHDADSLKRLNHDSNLEETHSLHTNGLSLGVLIHFLKTKEDKLCA